MANSYVFYTGDGATTDYTVPFPYIEEAHVHVLLDSIETTDFSFQSPSVIRFASAPGDGVEIRIYRDTSSSERLVDYNVPGNLTEEDLDLDSIQAFYLAQEAVDTATLAGPAAAEAAEAAQTAAEEAQAAAEQALDDAIAARDKAAQWSDNPEDDEVETGRYSAKHWAAKAEEAIGTLAGLPNSGDAGRVPMVNGSGTGYVLAGPLHGFRNVLINGDGRISQRASGSVAVGSSDGVYGPDRWGVRGTSGSGGTVTIASQSSTSTGSWPTGNYIYLSRTGLSSSTYLYQRIEDARTLAGKTVTLSFLCLSDASEDITLTVIQNFGSGGSSAVTVVSAETIASVAASTLQKVTYSFDIPHTTGKTLGANSYLEVRISPSATSGAFRISCIQLERGSEATDYDWRPLGVELALCQRYYQAGRAWYFGVRGTDLDGGNVQITFPVQMRASPAITIGGTFSLGDRNVDPDSVTALAPTAFGFGFQVKPVVLSEFIRCGRIYSADAEI